MISSSDMGQDENTDFILRSLDGIPWGFLRKLLEMPVGTGLLTIPVYQNQPDADITCLDYSADMMKKAQRRVQQGYVGKLPYETADSLLRRLEKQYRKAEISPVKSIVCF